ncbi:MAG: MFS transporter [Ktedonobacteraceae bacterium]
MSSLTPQRGLRLTHALQSRSFAIFWLGQTMSALGDGAFATALAIAVYQLTGSSLAMGLFLMAQIIPELIFTLFGGVAADRLPRRLVLVCSDVGRAVVVLLIALLAWLSLLQLWHLFVLAVLFGTIGAFFHPSYRAITPELVVKAHLSSANALTELSVQLGNLLGPILGAGLVVLSGGSASMAFAFDSLTFVISVFSLAAIRSVAKVVQENSNEGEIPTVGLAGMLWDIRDGFRTILRSSWLLWSMIAAAFGLMAYKGAIAVSLPKLVFAVYSSGPWLLATITTTVGLGAIAGALFAGQVHFRRRGIVGLLGYVLSGLALMVFSLPFPHSIVPFVVLPAAFLVGFGINVMQIIWVTLLYELVPSNKLGRVSSVDLLGSLGLLPIGYVLAGWLGDRVGPAAVFLLGGMVMVVLNLLPMLVRDIRRLE